MGSEQYRYAHLTFFIVHLLCFVWANTDTDHLICPTKCVCSKFHARSQPPFVEWLKLKCGGGSSADNIVSIDEINLDVLTTPSDVINLDLSGNNLTFFSSSTIYLPALQKLDLNRNSIEMLPSQAFANLTTLKRLDLSANRLKLLSREAFEGLMNVERLKLNQNLIAEIKEGTFDSLISLKQLDLSGNPLVCDCSLWWLLEWSRNSSVKLAPLPKCASPPSLHGQPLRKLKPGSEPHCDWPANPTLRLRPGKNQVVFEGDSLRLQCQTAESHGPESRVAWNWAGLDPLDIFNQTIQVETSHSDSDGSIESSLVIDHLKTNHSGKWNCELVSSKQNHSSTISVIVLSDETEYCAFSVTSDNKGTYSWPKTVPGNVVEVACQSGGGAGRLAHYTCSETGTWHQLDTGQCSYISETTRLLQQFAEMDLSNAREGVLESARQLHNYTINEADRLVDKMDVVYIARAVHNYLGFVSNERELGGLLMGILGRVMELPEDVLSAAQLEDRACTQLVAAVEMVAQHSPTPPSLAQEMNMAVEVFPVKRDSFLGITCNWYLPKGNTRLFHCSTTNKTALLGTQDKIIEASIQVPASLFYQLEMLGVPGTVSPQQLMVAMFQTSSLFPHTPHDGKSIGSSVVGTKLVGVEVGRLSEPIYVMLSAGLSGSPHPVWWDEARALWRQDGCQPLHLLRSLLVFQCHRLGYFALMQDMPAPSLHMVPRAKFRFSHPAIYVGTFVGTTCLMVAALTYMLCHASIQMADKMKHSLANTWLAITLLCIVFSLGIYQTEDVKVCQVIGLLLHYFTLSALFWMAVSINGMAKRMRKNEAVVVITVGEGGEVIVGQPLVGLYLVGWGISLLVCGLSGAVNQEPGGYAGIRYCSLGPGPGASAIVLPALALLLFLLARALIVCSAASKLDSNAQLSEGTQATDLELLGAPTNNANGSVRSVATPSSNVEDTQHSPATQLRAFLIVLSLYILVWTSATLVTLMPFGFPYEEDVFSLLYAVFTIALGVFVVFFYCFARSDVRGSWFTLKSCCRSRTVTDSHPAPLPLMSSESLTSSSVGAKPASFRPEPQGETAKINLVDLHRQQYHSNNSVVTNEAEVFYNPHQSTVARKFFKKQRRKQNNLGARRCGDGSSLFGPLTKVNNTNIHVELPTMCSNNLNVLNRPLERLVIGAEREKEPTLNNDGTVRTSGSCSCRVSETNSGLSDHSSHLYATVADDITPPQSAKLRHPSLTIDTKNEAVRINMSHCRDSEQLSTDSSNPDKRETCV